LLGGPWVLSNKRPACLRPMLKKKEYQDFVQKINEAVSWNHWGTEMIIFYITSFIIPPIAALIMVRNHFTLSFFMNDL
jgi:hypothetical protein